MSPTEELHSGDGDALQQYLVARGLPVTTRRRGLRGLVAAWETVARDAARYDLTLDDWRNDLDLRDIIAGAVEVASVDDQKETRDRLAKADALFLQSTVDTGRSLGGGLEVSGGRGHRASHWWYHRRPGQPGDTIRAELVAARLWTEG